MSRKIFLSIPVFVLSAMLLLSLGYVQAQTPGRIPVFVDTFGTEDDSDIFQDQNNNVGIGTTSPAAKLDVAGGNLNLDDSTPTAGNILKGGALFLHNFGTRNTFLGQNAGNLTMTGASNTAMGQMALSSNTTGTNNTASGLNALSSNTTGSLNAASGNAALFSNTTGRNNTANGSGALLFNTMGNFNTATGLNALANNSTGNENTAVGAGALGSGTGSSNTAVGSSALQANGSGSNNTAIGAGAGVCPVGCENLTNATAIGAGARVSQSNSLVLGNNANVGIGTMAPAANLDVRSSLQYAVLVQTTHACCAAIDAVALATTGASDGIRGRTHSLNGVGVAAESASGLPENLGLAVLGRGSFTGNIFKGGGGFQIDHPFDPANKYLNHSFVESPDMKNIYDGVVVLDALGEAQVELPSWFETINGDFRYQLTNIAAFAPVYIAEEISGNRFKIAGGSPGGKVSWQVTGIRKDRYAEKYRIRVEEEKPATEKGLYLHPGLYGQPQTKSIGQARMTPKD